MAETDDDTSTCFVCFEEYAESGDHIPRLLPCSHTMCDFCLRRLLRGAVLKCPECRMVHNAKRGVKTFPQNKYILKEIRRGKPEVYFDICEKHFREITLYCKESSCNADICPQCLTKDHRGHDVVDILQVKEEKFDLFLANAKNLERELQFNKDQLVATKKELKRHKEECVTKLRHKKAEYANIFDKMIEQVYDDPSDTAIDNEITAIGEYINSLENLKQGVNHRTTKSCTELNKKLTAIQTMVNRASKHFSGGRTFKYPDYNRNPNPVIVSVGKLIRKEVRITLSKAQHVTQNTCSLFRPVEGLTLKRAFPRSWFPAPLKKLRYKVIDNINADHVSYIYNISAIGRGGVVVCGKEGEQHVLRVVRQEGERSSVAILDGQPDGMTVVDLCGKQCAAVSYGIQKRVIFYDVEDLEKPVLVLPTGPHQPERLYSPSGAKLLYEDCSKVPRQIRWLDCSISPPLVTDVTTTGQHTLHDLCFVDSGAGKRLLIVCDSKQGVCAYDAISNQLAWRAKSTEIKLKRNDWQMSAQGVAADEESFYLYVCDVNNRCVQMFSMTDGRYMGTLLPDDGEPLLGDMTCISWCKDTQSIAVAHCTDDNQWKVTFIIPMEK